MHFSENDSIFAQLYQVAERFFETLLGTMNWLFFEPFTILQTLYWDSYSAIAGSPYEPYLKPIYQYFAWASGAPTVIGDEISFGVFLLTAGAGIWVLIKVIVFIVKLVLDLASVISNLWKPK